MDEWMDGSDLFFFPAACSLLNLGRPTNGTVVWGRFHMPLIPVPEL